MFLTFQVKRVKIKRVQIHGQSNLSIFERTKPLTMPHNNTRDGEVSFEKEPSSNLEKLFSSTVNVCRMSHRKWREIKQQLIRLPDLALLGCSLLSLHILCDIVQTFTVHTRCLRT